MLVNSRLVLATSLMVVLPLLAACDKIAEKATEAAVEHATGTEVDKDGGSITIKSDKGNVKIVSAEDGETVALPESFPSDVFLPAQRKVESMIEMGGMHSVTLHTPAATAAVYADAQKALESGGWKRDVAMQSADGSTLAYSKGKRNVLYSLTQADSGGTELTVNITTQQ